MKTENRGHWGQEGHFWSHTVAYKESWCRAGAMLVGKVFAEQAEDLGLDSHHLLRSWNDSLYL